MRIAAAQTGEQRRHEAGEGNNRVAAEGAEQQVEPDYVRLKLVQRFQEAKYTVGIIERPAAQDIKSRGLGRVR